MLAPHELKNKTFTKVYRGYNTVEVDQYFDFLVEKYTELYKDYAELEQKYNNVSTKYNEIANEEESIRSAILKAQKLGEVIVSNAEKEAETFKANLQEKCDVIVAEAKEKVQKERDTIVELRKSALDFKEMICKNYLNHLQALKEMNIEEDENVAETLPSDERLDEAESTVLAKAGIIEEDDLSDKSNIISANKEEPENITTEE